MTIVHATAVACDGAAALLVGPSGAGKSDLALRLIDRGWGLLADDYVILARTRRHLIARCPPTTRGLLEIRGLGIARMAFVAAAPVALFIDLARPPERLPDRRAVRLLGLSIEIVAMAPFEASTPIKLERAFARARRSG